MSRAVTSVFMLEKQLDAMLAARQTDEALRLIQDTVERILAEPICTAGVFASALLDRYCQNVGAATLAVESLPSTKKGVCSVYIVTKLQKSGGHARALEDLIRAAPEGSTHVILSTELLGASDRVVIENNLRDYNVTCEWNEDTAPSQKLRWLQTRVRALTPESVWLFNHHQDSVAVAAVQPEQGYRAYYYHHGDHHLCLGVTLAYPTHIDPLPMGFHHCRDELGIKENIYVPLWMKDGGERPASCAFRKDGKITTCTAAKFNKVEVPYFISYVEMIPAIIQASGGRHVHIGALTPWALWRIKRGLKNKGIDVSRFVYTPWEPSVWQALHKYNVDLYIASFPIDGARTLIEAMGSGTPVAVHDHIATRMLSCADMVYPEAFVWRDPEALCGFLGSLSADFLNAQSQTARAFFLKQHDRALYQNIDIGRMHIMPPSPRLHKPDALQWGMDVTRHTTLFGVAWRFLYRHRRILTGQISRLRRR